MNMEGSDHTSTTESQEDKEFQPRGIIVFLSIMLVVYVIYWAYLWYVVTIQRGIGG